MKRSFLFLVLLITTVMQAQNSEIDLKSNWNDYNQLLADSKLEKAMDMVHPGIFTIVPRESMISMFEGLMNSEEMEIRFLGHEINLINDPVKSGSDTYYLFNYKQIMGMKISDVEKEESGFDSKNLVMMGLQKQYGDKNVVFNDQTEFYNITSDKKGVAMYEESSKSWKYLSLQDGQKLLLEKFLPEEVIKYIYK